MFQFSTCSPEDPDSCAVVVVGHLTGVDHDVISDVLDKEAVLAVVFDHGVVHEELRQRVCGEWTFLYFLKIFFTSETKTYVS